MSYFTRWTALGIGLTLIIALVVLKFFWVEPPSLELQAGTYLVLEVDSKYVKNQKLDQIRDDIRRALREAGIGFRGLSVKDDAVEAQVRDTELLPTALAKLRDLPQPLGGPKGQRSLEVADAGEGLIRLSVAQAATAEHLDRIIEQSIEIVEKRINELGTVTPIIQRQGTDRILVQLPGLQDPIQVMRLLGSAGKMEFRMVDDSVSPDQAQQGMLPPDSELLLGATPRTPPAVVKKQVLVPGDDVIDAQLGFDSRNNEPVVNFKFSTSGARKFARATTENVGNLFAIVLDGKVISAPRIREPITGGQGQISGNFTAESASDLAILLRAGTLPAPLKVVEQRTVGPGQWNRSKPSHQD